jgi:hypothetical protein
MKTDTSKNKESVFGRIRTRLSGSPPTDSEKKEQEISNEKTQIVEDFDAVKKQPGHLTGWDFERAFDFIDRFPDSEQAEILKGQMYATTGQALKGLSYASAVKVLQRMPEHDGSASIFKGMRLLEEDFIRELRTDVIIFLIENIPDHRLAKELTTALATKNLTSAYDFVINYPDNIHTRRIIKAMFDKDPNVAVLLLQEKMDHPQVASIFDGIYGIVQKQDIKNLTPNAVIFILDVAPDHPCVEQMIEVLVQSNYVKAYEFIKQYPDHDLAGMIREKILVRNPELKRLFDRED